MTDTLRCVGYVKPMPDIAPIDLQKKHIADYVNKHQFSLERLYIEDSSDSVNAFRQLIDDAVHRDFDVLILDSIFCFGHAIFSAADFMENVLLLLGFKVIFLDDMMDSDDIRFRWYLKNKRDVSRNSFAKYAAKKKKPNPKKERIEKCTDEYIHSVEWYESRQNELFQEMLTFPDNFDMLEEEMQFCRRAIKNLRL